MDIKKYALFADIAETQNFTKSGNRMGYTQSGVSHILKSLEMELGFPLFIRTKQGVKLTKDACLVLPLVRTLLATNENLEQTINSINGLECGHLTIATFSSISIHWLPNIIHRFQNIYPGIDIDLMEGGTDDIVKWIKNDVVDFGLLSKRNTKSLEWISLREDPLMAVLPKNYQCASCDYFKIEDFQDKPFIISATGTDYDVHHALKCSNVVPHIQFSSKDDHAIISMVANHLGISILPQLILNQYKEDILALPLKPYYSRNLGIALKSKENVTPASVKFIRLVKEMLPELL